MPYIRGAERANAAKYPESPGELNFALTMCAIKYLQKRKAPKKFRTDISDIVAAFIDRRGLSYTTLNTVMGALDCCGRELIRRVKLDVIGVHPVVREFDTLRDNVYTLFAAPYEDKKIVENGDVFPTDLVKEDDE